MSDIDNQLKAIGALTIEEQMGSAIKFEYHTGVTTVDDVLWLVKSGLKESLELQNRIVLEHGGNPDSVPDDHELYDFVVGKSAAYKDVYIHLTKALGTSNDT